MYIVPYLYKYRTSFSTFIYVVYVDILNTKSIILRDCCWTKDERMTQANLVEELITTDLFKVSFQLWLANVRSSLWKQYVGLDDALGLTAMAAIEQSVLKNEGIFLDLVQVHLLEMDICTLSRLHCFFMQPQAISDVEREFCQQSFIIAENKLVNHALSRFNYFLFGAAA